MRIVGGGIGGLPYGLCVVPLGLSQTWNWQASTGKLQAVGPYRGNIGLCRNEALSVIIIQACSTITNLQLFIFVFHVKAVGAG